MKSKTSTSGLKAALFKCVLGGDIKWGPDSAPLISSGRESLGPQKEKEGAQVSNYRPCDQWLTSSGWPVDHLSFVMQHVWICFHNKVSHFIVLMFCYRSTQIYWLWTLRESLWSRGLSSEVQPLPSERAGPERQRAAGFRSEASLCWTGESKLSPGDSEVSSCVSVSIYKIQNRSFKFPSVHLFSEFAWAQITTTLLKVWHSEQFDS